MNRKNYRILIVDDEASIRLLLRRILEDEGYQVDTAHDGKDALARATAFHPHLCLIDLKMPVMDGMTFLDEYKKVDQDTQFIILTAYGTVETAIKAMKSGVLDYILKPLKDPDELRHAVEKAFERARLIDENMAMKAEAMKGLPPREIVFGGMENLWVELEAVAPTSATVLITGETGTGKNLLARYLHIESGRTGPFIEVNCATIAATLIESELFGHERGAFTGAAAAKKGKFEIAAGGTVFLDEISEMNTSLQAKLLRVLQDGSFERLGSNITQTTDARIVCATNRDIQKEVAEGRFREDLYFRLNVFPLHLPPLRERKERIPAIASYLATSLSARCGKRAPAISGQSMDMLKSYYWPGNIRELSNILERAVILCRTDELCISSLPGHPGKQQGQAEPPKPENMATGNLKDYERTAIEEALSKSEGNRRKAAQLLDISLRALQYKIKEYELK